MVQEMGLWLLQREDRIIKDKEEVVDLKHALLASGMRTVEDLFPEYFRVSAEDVDFDQQDTEYDFSDVEFAGPDGMSAEELAELEDFLGGQVTVQSQEEWF